MVFQKIFFTILKKKARSALFGAPITSLPLHIHTLHTPPSNLTTRYLFSPLSLPKAPVSETVPKG